jgi:hypothetical protein
MSQRAVLNADDIVVYTAPTQQAIHAAVMQVYSVAKVRAAMKGPDRTDADGEIHERRYRLTFGEVREDRSERQNKFYWAAVLKQIADQAPGGWTVDAWHEAFKRTVLGYETIKVMVAGRKRPTIYRRLRSTTDLTVPQMSQYLDQVIADATTALGVVFDLDPVEREAVRHVKKARRKAQEEATA